MDALNALLSGRRVERKTVAGGSTNGRIQTEYEEPKYVQEKVPEKTRQYAQPFVEKLKNEVWDVS